MAGVITHHTIAIAQVLQTIQGARRLGLDVSAILRRAGIAPVLLDSPLSRVTQAQYAALIRVLRRVCRDELWGLCSRPVKVGSFAQICQALVQRRTLGEALRTAFAFYHLALHDFVPRLQVQGNVAHVAMVTLRERDPPLDYAQRSFCFLGYGLMSWLVARRIPLSCVFYPPQLSLPYGTEAERLFQAPVSYAQSRTGLEFDASWLQLPIVQTPQSLKEFMRQASMVLVVRYRDQARLGERIRRMLWRHLSAELPSLEQVSQSLAMTPQTVRRHLREEGQGYQAIKDNLRRDAAIEYLNSPDLTLDDIARRLGFSEASTFHRAFKGWTGVAPGIYRQTRL
jgi:AraC-like DNA-binding protein